MRIKIEHQKLGGQVLAIGDIFYLSPIVLNHNISRRGGIPVIFPQFASRGPLVKHGFARTNHWQLELDDRSGDRGRLIYTLRIASGDFPGWAHEGFLEVEVLTTGHQIQITLKVKNTGTTQFSWTGGLHPYFFVDNLLETRIEGLLGTMLEVSYLQAKIEGVEAKALLTFSEEGFEALCYSQPPLRLVTPKRCIYIESEGFQEWMIWNPGREGSKALDDLPDVDWLKFICIEPVTVSIPIVLNAGDSFKGRLKIFMEAPE